MKAKVIDTFVPTELSAENTIFYWFYIFIAYLLVCIPVNSVFDTPFDFGPLCRWPQKPREFALIKCSIIRADVGALA